MLLLSVAEDTENPSELIKLNRLNLLKQQDLTML